MKIFKILLTFFIFFFPQNADCSTVEQQLLRTEDNSAHTVDRTDNRGRGNGKRGTPPPTFTMLSASQQLLVNSRSGSESSTTSESNQPSRKAERAKSADPRTGRTGVSPQPGVYSSPLLATSRHPTPQPQQVEISAEKQEVCEQLNLLKRRLEAEKAGYNEWLVYLCTAYMAYPDRTREKDKFKPPATNPDDFLRQGEYELERLSQDVVRVINHSNQSVIYGIRGTSCSLTARTTLGSFYNWGIQHYDDALKEGSPWYIKILGKPWGQPFTNCIRSLMAFTAFNFIRLGYYYLNHSEHCPTSLIFGIMSFVFGMTLYCNAIPYIFTGVYMNHVSSILDTIEKDKVLERRKKFVTGHSLGGNIAQAVGVFNEDVLVRSISAIGGAYPTCCDMNARLAKSSGKSRSVCSLDDLQSRTKGLMGAGDPVECLAHIGDIKHVPVEHTGDDSMSAHRLNNLIFALFCLEASVARDLHKISEHIEPQLTLEKPQVKIGIAEISVAADKRNLEKQLDKAV